MNILKCAILVLLSFSGNLSVASASASLELNQTREALQKKTENYLKEGLISGGDRDIHSGLVKNIRRALNGNFERIVIDIDADKVPYYQAAIEPEQRRILVTIFGGPKLGLNAKKITADFAKSSLVKAVELFPKLEEDAWTFALHLRAVIPVEVFELSAPTRIILDLKGGGALMSELLHKAKMPSKTGTHPARRAVKNLDEGNGASAHSEDIPE